MVQGALTTEGQATFRRCLGGKLKASKPCGGQLSGRLEADVVAGQGSKWSPALKAAELMPTSQMPSKPRLGGAGTRRGLSPSPSQLLPKTLPPQPDPLCTSQGSRQCWVAAPTGSGSRILWCLAAGPGTAAPRHPSCPGWWGNILNVRAASSLGTLSVEAMVRAVSLVLNCDSEALVPAHVERSLAETPACVVHLGAGHWSTIALLPVCCFLLPCFVSPRRAAAAGAHGRGRRRAAVLLPRAHPRCTSGR